MRWPTYRRLQASLPPGWSAWTRRTRQPRLREGKGAGRWASGDVLGPAGSPDPRAAAPVGPPLRQQTGRRPVSTYGSWPQRPPRRAHARARWGWCWRSGWRRAPADRARAGRESQITAQGYCQAVRMGVPSSKRVPARDVTPLLTCAAWGPLCAPSARTIADARCCLAARLGAWVSLAAPLLSSWLDSVLASMAAAACATGLATVPAQAQLPDRHRHNFRIRQLQAQLLDRIAMVWIRAVRAAEE